MSVLDHVIEQWGLTPVEGALLHESRSAASVSRVESRHGQAFLKVTTPSADEAAMMDARRELVFYTDVAPAVPQVAPHLLDAYDEDDGIALLLEDAGRVLPVEAWSVTQWTQLAETVRQVHELSPGPRYEFSVPRPLPDAFKARSSEVEEFWRSLYPTFDEVFRVVSELLPPVLAGDSFVHGDLHLDNVIVSGERGGVRIADWQQCGFGSAAADLAFVNVRLAPAGQLPPEAFLSAYAAGGGESLTDLRRAVWLVELATYLLVWPPFAAYNSSDGVANVRSRTADLATWVVAGATM